eukprot:CAMPEP_0195265690 /NCGR_PEP_ID=MMETSP0706-20130129/11580_1 /TAXON_ID=33640 /ORGANISM="Asterionellopsis glacialis, Strain CCMP134" /LENGTH=35 /DNA_ID= /DNA_START= /DNA_END= /DNA_ORIENTATION=
MTLLSTFSATTILNALHYLMIQTDVVFLEREIKQR